MLREGLSEPDPFEHLRLIRWGLGFAEPSTERDYRTWQCREAVAMIRLGLFLSIVNWIVAATAALAYARHPARALLWIGGGPLPWIVISLVASYRPNLQRWMLPAAAFASTTSGFVVVALLFWEIELPMVSAGAVAIVEFFAFTIFRLRPAMASVATLPYLIAHGWLAFEGYRTGVIAGNQLVVMTMTSQVAFMSGLFACAVIDRISRQAYRQERIAEIQRATIERERERADVAERARALSEALARLPQRRGPLKLVAGDVVDERYRVTRMLGAGGMGEVHEVERIADGRALALKVLTTASNREALTRFAREAEIAAKIDHPNVVNVIDVGVAPSGMFLVMELITGGTLAAERSRYGDIAWGVPMLRQIAEALAAMHALGIVHRDLKPSNILIAAGRPKIADFGIARLADEDPPSDVINATDATIDEGRVLTRTGVLLGTPLYMAPELNDGVRAAEAAVDVWSFGVLAHELLARGLPFDEPPLLAPRGGHVQKPMKPFAVSGIPTATSALIDRCLHFDPTQRPRAHELARALRET
jgi:predicted Ser/Thr protein kinase